MITTLAKYSKLASAGEKARVRQSLNLADAAPDDGDAAADTVAAAFAAAQEAPAAPAKVTLTAKPRRIKPAVNVPDIQNTPDALL